MAETDTRQQLGVSFAGSRLAWPVRSSSFCPPARLKLGFKLARTPSPSAHGCDGVYDGSTHSSKCFALCRTLLRSRHENKQFAGRFGTLLPGCPQALRGGSEDGPVPPALLRLASAAALQARGTDSTMQIIMAKAREGRGISFTRPWAVTTLLQDAFFE